MNPVPEQAGGTGFCDTLLKDIRFGTRLLRRNPCFTSLVVLTLALGIGATSSVFSLIQGVLLTPPPYPNPEQIILVQPTRIDGKAYVRGPSTEQWTQWQDQTKSAEAM